MRCPLHGMTNIGIPYEIKVSSDIFEEKTFFCEKKVYATYGWLTAPLHEKNRKCTNFAQGVSTNNSQFTKEIQIDYKINPNVVFEVHFAFTKS